VGELAVVVLAAGFAEAVRALGWAGSALLYTFAASAVVLVSWLFALSG
jgi:hypothetical protein